MVDNASEQKVKEYLQLLKRKNRIDKILFLKKNQFWAKGNNLGVSLSSPDTEYVLLLNSDVELMHKDLLKLMVSLCPEKGAISFGAQGHDCYLRPDGYCLMLKKELFEKVGGIDESVKLWGAELTLMHKLISFKYKIALFVPPVFKYLVHYGSKSVLIPEKHLLKEGHIKTEKLRQEVENYGKQMIWILNENFFFIFETKNQGKIARLCLKYTHDFLDKILLKNKIQ